MVHPQLAAPLCRIDCHTGIHAIKADLAKSHQAACVGQVFVGNPGTDIGQAEPQEPACRVPKTKLSQLAAQANACKLEMAGSAYSN